MRPNNQYTSPDSRFFYPTNYEVEHHESLDTTSLPGTEHIPGRDHYVVLNDGDEGVWAAELAWESYNIPVGATVLGVKGFVAAAPVSISEVVPAEAFEVFDPECSYLPNEGEGVQVIVQANVPDTQGRTSAASFGQRGVRILPFGTPMPSLAEHGVPDDALNYRLLGFISSGDKLVTWHDEASHTALLTDWSVANQLKQNALEEALFIDALPLEGHLVGLLHTHEVVRTYLAYFDEKHSTTFTPQQDPRYLQPQFDRLTTEELQTYERLSSLARYFMTHLREAS